ncbi:MAG: redoxin domain-containing protein [Anaerolineales bacterium]|nr:redoxin domain-containing protein [Anaerolineales bacterium]
MGLNTQVLGISVDHVPCLQAWAESLDGITYPLLSDFWPHGEVARKYGVFIETDGHTERAIFVIDKDGIFRYVDIHDIDEQPSNDALRRVIREIDPEAGARQPEPEPEEEALPHGGIVMYCTKWCPGCYRARRFFADRNLEFTEVDVNTTPGAAEQVIAWTGGYRTTPTFDIDGLIVIDWAEARLVDALKKKGYL